MLDGSIYLDPTLDGVPCDDQSSAPDPLALSRCELEVVRLRASDPSITEIAERLGRTVSAVSRQRRAAMDKPGIRTDVELFAYAREQGLASLPPRARNRPK